MLMTAVMLTVQWMQKKEEVIAAQKDEIDSKSFAVTCSPDFIKEIKKYPGCYPKQCG